MSVLFDPVKMECVRCRNAGDHFHVSRDEKGLEDFLVHVQFKHGVDALALLDRILELAEEEEG